MGNLMLVPAPAHQICKGIAFVGLSTIFFTTREGSPMIRLIRQLVVSINRGTPIHTNRCCNPYYGAPKGHAWLWDTLIPITVSISCSVFFSVWFSIFGITSLNTCIPVPQFSETLNPIYPYRNARSPLKVSRNFGKPQTLNLLYPYRAPTSLSIKGIPKFRKPQP